MTSPYVTASAASTRTEKEVRAAPDLYAALGNLLELRTLIIGAVEARYGAETMAHDEVAAAFKQPSEALAKAKAAA